MKSSSSFRVSLTLISGAFLLWGILRAQNDLLVALFSASGLTHYATATLIHLSFFSAYLLASIPAGICLTRWGYRKTLCMSLVLMAFGSAICVPAVLRTSFSLCLIGIFLVACGIAVLQTSANPCIGLLGSNESATVRMLLVQGCSSLGSALGPLAGIVLFGGWSLRSSSTPLVFPGKLLAASYTAMTACLVLVVVLVRRFFDDRHLIMRNKTPKMERSVRCNTRLRFGITAAFLYVGCEATLLAYSIPYLSHHYTSGLLPGTAAALLSVYWLAVVCGRLCAAKLLKLIDTRTLLQGSCVLAFLLVQVAVFRGGNLGAFCLLATGFCNAVVFPSIFNLSVSGVREDELPSASAFLSMAICGGGVMPVLSGLLVDRFGVITAFLLPSAAYAAIALCSGIFFSKEYYLKDLRLKAL